MPAGAVDADFELSREGAFSDLAVDGGPGQPGPGEAGLKTDDTIWFVHGRAASCWLFLTIPDPERTGRCGRARASCTSAYYGVQTAENRMDSNFDAPPSAEVNAVGEGEFEAEPAA